MRLAFAIALFLHILGAIFAPEYVANPYTLREKEEMDIVDIPDQYEIPPPPKEEAKPQVPTEVEVSEDAPEEATIEDTDFSPEAPPVIPPAPEEPPVFYAFDEPPKLIKLVEPRYPELAQRAELEGVVMLQILVDEKGNVIDTRVLQGVGGGLDEAAQEAAMQCKFTPAKQRDVPVRVWVAFPVTFVLRK
jgi:protein TonB